jgi:hypothetical protein
MFKEQTPWEFGGNMLGTIWNTLGTPNSQKSSKQIPLFSCLMGIRDFHRNFSVWLFQMFGFPKCLVRAYAW